MSGPKVIRIVTREEVIAICQRHLSRLDAAIAEWTRVCERSGTMDASAAAAIAQRRSALQHLLTTDRFLDLQKQVPTEISYLQSDAEARIARAADAAAQALQQRRRMASTARMLLEELARSGRPIPEDLQRDLRSAQPEEAVSRALQLLAPPSKSTAPSERQRQLASRLRGPERTLTLSEWLATHPPAQRDFELKIDRHLAELTALGVDTDAYTRKATAVCDEPPARQALLADSLLVELAQALKEARGRATQVAALRECLAELVRHDSAAARELTARIEAAIAQGDLSSAPALLVQAEALEQERLRLVAAEARRRAVLQGLASLGYEVHEGMATAWVQGGHVVLKKAGNPGYGLEVAGGTKSDRVQVRAVAFGSASTPRDPARDRDVETLWCSELQRLRDSLSLSGGALDIEQALAPGTTPLKVVEDSGTREAIEVSAPISRTLPR